MMQPVWVMSRCCCRATGDFADLLSPVPEYEPSLTCRADCECYIILRGGLFARVVRKPVIVMKFKQTRNRHVGTSSAAISGGIGICKLPDIRPHDISMFPKALFTSPKRFFHSQLRGFCRMIKWQYYVTLPNSRRTLEI